MMRTAFLALLAFVFVGATVSACGGGDQSKQEAGTSAATPYQSITAQQLHDMMQQKDFLLVNVHIPYAGDIPGTDLSIPFNEIEKNVDRLPQDKNAKLVLYCRSGHMSGIAVKELASLGYKNLYDLEGGMKAWVAAGYELVQRQQ